MSTINSLSHEALKEKQRQIRAGFPSGFSLRIHRAISWLKAAALANDTDNKFIFLWIAFNAAYARKISMNTFEHNQRKARGVNLNKYIQKIPLISRPKEKEVIKEYFETLLKADSDRQISQSIKGRLKMQIHVMIKNKFIYQPFWSHHSKIRGFHDWQKSLREENEKIRALIERERGTEELLYCIFSRFYVLRNQLLHGGATWGSGRNRDSISESIAVLEYIIPIFIDLMMDNPHKNWGEPEFPVIEDAPKAQETGQ